LAVEVDGGIHLEQEQRERDKLRDELLLELGIRTLRVTADDVEKRIERVLAAIDRAVSQSTSNRATIDDNSETPPLHANGEGAGG
jgi:very-short-patch-repair endonuclease